MSDAARRKERQRLKREKKKGQHRRAMAASPYKRIGQAGKLEACYINAGWQENGLASIHLVRENPQRGFALACFLIDLWCAGFKDAWGQLNLLHDDIDRHVDRAEERFELVRIEPDAARHLVAGAIRFARQNGFRLPAHYERWVNLLGEIPDPATADLRSFGKDGGLLWVGSLEDLGKRLIGCSLDDFLDRPDVDFVAPEEGFDEPDWEDESEDDSGEEIELDEALDQSIEDTCKRLTRFCASRGEPLPPLMRDAVQLVLAGCYVQVADLDLKPADDATDSPPPIKPLTAREILGPKLESACTEPMKEAVVRVAHLMRDMVDWVPSENPQNVPT